MRAQFVDPQGGTQRLTPWVGWALLLSLIGLAYRGGFGGVLDFPVFRQWFFAPGQDLAWLAMAISFWMLSSRLPSIEPTSHRPAFLPSITLFALSLICLAWARWTTSAGWLLPSISAFVLALAHARGGRAGWRALRTPALTPLLAFPIPDPLRSEIVWQLQLLTARSGFLAARLGGQAAELENTEIRIEPLVFVVIDSCSGLSGILLLLLVAAVTTELTRVRGFRRCMLIGMAIPIGILLNLLRAGIVVLTQPEAFAGGFASHTPQGLAVLAVGALALYALGRRLGNSRTPVTPEPENRTWGVAPGLALCAGLLAAIISFWTPDSDPREAASEAEPILFEATSGGWSSEELPLDYFFPYSSPREDVRRRYQRKVMRGEQTIFVDVYIARETKDPAGLSRLPTEKLLLPSRDWTLESHSPKSLWGEGLTIQQAVVTRSDLSERAMVFAWRKRDAGFWVETARSAFGLDLRPSGVPRTVIRLSTPLASLDPFAVDRANRTLTRFVKDWRERLGQL